MRDVMEEYTFEQRSALDVLKAYYNMFGRGALPGEVARRLGCTPGDARNVLERLANAGKIDKSVDSGVLGPRVRYTFRC